MVKNALFLKNLRFILLNRIKMGFGHMEMGQLCEKQD